MRQGKPLHHHPIGLRALVPGILRLPQLECLPQPSPRTNPSLFHPSRQRSHFADTHSKGDRSALAQQLWSAVEAGDSSAEAALAELYLAGEGVPRSCEQARVLLRAATKKGNTAAGQQLRKLNNNGCR